jgi:RNA polymerase sigma factor (TIGR02999 family)
MESVTRPSPLVGPSAPQSAAELLPIVYEELRQLAAQKLAQENPGQTLQATALVHEAWLRLVGAEPRQWNGSSHFFYAAAQAMRRILVENARRKQRLKHGGENQRVNVDDIPLASPMKADELLAVDEGLERLAQEDPEAAQLVELRFFAGLGHQEAAVIMGISRRTADGLWSYARTWLYEAMRGEES